MTHNCNLLPYYKLFPLVDLGFTSCHSKPCHLTSGTHDLAIEVNEWSDEHNLVEEK